MLDYMDSFRLFSERIFPHKIPRTHFKIRNIFRSVLALQWHTWCTNSYNSRTRILTYVAAHEPRFDRKERPKFDLSTYIRLPRRDDHRWRREVIHHSRDTMYRITACCAYRRIYIARTEETVTNAWHIQLSRIYVANLSVSHIVYG